MGLGAWALGAPTERQRGEKARKAEDESVAPGSPALNTECGDASACLLLTHPVDPGATTRLVIKTRTAADPSKNQLNARGSRPFASLCDDGVTSRGDWPLRYVVCETASWL